ncbi:class I glutamine amidotransferase-like protein [Lasiosphaeria ovina]|uniref:Class I glutamine amidotransferase-like protein n=1 Tax=Lasiosphaeria ovina TaxID=92902 RepID=A0AAE0N4B3_9PEZI|nr:class I glutamine amidotransferase-like protein [Lasiosphaeria ovina]
MKSTILQTLVLLTGSLAHAALDPDKALSIGIILFPGFQPLDVIGPLDVFAGASGQQNMTISFIWKTTGPVSSIGPPRLFPGTPNPKLLPSIYPRLPVSVVATHTFADAPPLDVLLVPGGIGNRFLNDTGDTSMEDFVAARYPSLQYLLSVCTGAATLAKSGVLRGRRATTNKAAWAWATSFGEGVQWTPSARWTEDGNVWTSSGVSAGIDMTYAFVRALLGDAVAKATINGIEYTPHVDREWDPYSVVFNVSGGPLLPSSLVCGTTARWHEVDNYCVSSQVTGANTTRPLGDCVGPAGYSFDCSGSLQ